METKPSYEEIEQRINELKKIEDAYNKIMGESEISDERHRAILGSFEGGYYEVDLTGNLTFFNDSMGEILGYQANELIGANYRQFMDEKTIDNVHQKRSNVCTTGHLISGLELQCIRRDGSKRRVELSIYPIRDSKDQATGFRGVMRDITSRRKSEEDLRDSEELFRGISTSALDAIIMIDNDERISFWNPAARKIFGYTWEEVSGKKLHSFLVPEKYHEDFKKGYENFKESGEGFAIGKTLELSAINKEGAEFPIEISLSAMKRKGKWVAIGTIRDASARKKSEKELRDNLALLRQTMAGIVESMALTVETRDPYTAGHQRRVSGLSRAIAQEMGLSKSQVEGIRTAGIIHDIGKLNVPSDILAKPVRLSELEFGLIKTHSQVSYDILVGIKFAWPIANIAYQHHERLDGSGYPQGLSKDDILIEARILAVADVVEAMASHRPYRPALDIQEAIDEICNNKDILYDPDAVDACIKVIKEKKFELKPEQNAIFSRKGN